MKTPILGLHHVTAITSDAQKNLDFYGGVLGLRLVKRTVNFDDPTSYHLYYGDQSGAPGTILTFFVWPNASRGRLGVGETNAIALSVARGSQNFWRDRLAQKNIAIESDLYFGDEVLSLTDPDGIALEIVECDDARSGWSNGEIPIEYSIRGLHSVTLGYDNIKRASQWMKVVMGFRFVSEENERARFSMQDGNAGALIDIVSSGEKRGQMGAGTVHHIAFRVADDATQNQWRDELMRLGFGVSPVMDRTYFHSIYFREPGGVLFEIATDSPGFTVDESIETLGESLKLPPQYETKRAQIEAILPPLLHDLRDS